MMCWIARGLTLAAATLVLPAASRAQPTAEMTLGSSLQSLRGASDSADARATVIGSATAGLGFASGRGFFGYTIDGGTWATPGDWSYLQHRLEGRHRVDLLKGALRIHLGARGTLRRNGEAWASADYDALGGFLNVEAQPASGLTLRTGYRLDRRTFGEIPALDQTEQDAFASVLVNLETRTTLIAEAHTGWKSYRSTVESPAYGGQSASGQGRGRRGGAGGMGPSLRPSAPALAPPTGDDARQLTLLARLAQSLGDRTGLSLQGSWRTTAGQVPPMVVTTPAGFFDDGVYDDPFASDLTAAQLRLKHVRPGGAVFEANGRRFRQSFVAALALDASGGALPGEPLRVDDVWRFDAEAALPVFPSRTGSVELQIEIGYAFTRSRSNDAFYDYSSHGAGLALALRY